jgi:integrase/recombinase XerD
MRRAGAKIDMLKGDWPKLTKSQVETYTEGQLDAFFAACNADEKLLFQTFLLSGFRHMEIATLWDTDIDDVGSLAVTAKDEIGFSPKTFKECRVAVPLQLVVNLRSKASASKSHLLFPTPAHPTRPEYGGDGVDDDMLDKCKHVAFRAGLNCGKCNGSKHGPCSTNPTCEHWYLHKFRHTFATNMLRSGMDIKTLQVAMGHSSISTTEKYLQALSLKRQRDTVENSSLMRFLN